MKLLIYAVSEDAALHPKARAWLEGAVSAFLRLTTGAGLFRRPLRVETAFDVVDE